MSEIRFLTRKSIIGALGEEKEHPQVRSPAGNHRLDYSRDLQWRISGDDCVYHYGDDEGVGVFFDAQLNEVSDIVAARVGFPVAELKAKRRRVDRLFKMTEEINAMAKAELEAAQASVQEDASPVAEPSVKEINDLAELAAEHGERAFPVKKS
jgi:hypothetical protein